MWRSYTTQKFGHIENPFNLRKRFAGLIERKGASPVSDAARTYNASRRACQPLAGLLRADELHERLPALLVRIITCGCSSHAGSPPAKAMMAEYIWTQAKTREDMVFTVDHYNALMRCVS